MRYAIEIATGSIAGILLAGALAWSEPRPAKSCSCDAAWIRNIVYGSQRAR
ncbi:MAG: hypothetical protein HYX27_05840 [Acidobacteria bacterium]|nr:hypothetical protein [Acidobacteriota bacterium]